MNKQSEKLIKYKVPPVPEGYPPQLTFNWINVPILHDHHLTKYEQCVFAMVHNMKVRNINLYQSFSGKEIAWFSRSSSASITRAKRGLAKKGLVSEEGELLWEVPDDWEDSY